MKNLVAVLILKIHQVTPIMGHQQTPLLLKEKLVEQEILMGVVII